MGKRKQTKGKAPGGEGEGTPDGSGAASAEASGELSSAASTESGGEVSSEPGTEVVAEIAPEQTAEMAAIPDDGPSRDVMSSSDDADAVPSSEESGAAPSVVVEGERTAEQDLTDELPIEALEEAEAAVDADSDTQGVGRSGESDGVVLSFTEAAAADEATPPADQLEIGQVASIIESLLFAADRALSMADLKRLLDERSPARIEDAMEVLKQRQEGTGLQIVSVAGGYSLRTAHANASWVGKLLVGKPVRLSRAMLETLAIVAYRQPITRPEIDDIRGVDCGPVLKTLLERNLIRVIGKKEDVGRPLLYGTTPEFLKTFNLRDLTELPTLREFHELGDEEAAKVRQKHPSKTMEAAAPDAAAVAETPSKAAFSPSAPLPDRPEDEELLDELDRAADAAARALGTTNQPPDSSSGPA